MNESLWNRQSDEAQKSRTRSPKRQKQTWLLKPRRGYFALTSMALNGSQKNCKRCSFGYRDHGNQKESRISNRAGDDIRQRKWWKVESRATRLAQEGLGEVPVWTFQLEQRNQPAGGSQQKQATTTTNNNNNNRSSNDGLYEYVG